MRQGLIALLSALALVALWLGLSLVSQSLLPQPRHFDLEPRYIGCQALFAGRNPYSEAVTIDIQLAMFGGRSAEDWDQFAFAYPANVCFSPLTPLWALPRLTAAYLWMGAILVGFLVLLLSAPYALGTPEPGVLPVLMLTLLGSFGFFYPVEVYILAQPTPLALFCAFGAMLAWRHGWRGLAALLLTGVAIRPEGIVVALTLAGLALVERDWRFLGWLALVGGVVYGLVTLYLGPLWPLDWLGAVGAYADYAIPVWPPGLAGPLGAPLVMLGVLLWGGWALRRARQLPEASTRAWWRLSVVILVSLIVLPQTRSYTLIWGLMPLLVALWTVERRDALTWLLFAVATLSPWLMFVGREYWGWPHRVGDLVTPVLMLLVVSWQGLRAGDAASAGSRVAAPGAAG